MINERYLAAWVLRCTVGVLLGCGFFAPTAQGQVNLDVGRWLNRPDVKLVVVEFYATWCPPCMDAIPRWKALHEKYRDKGLRLIVVNTRDTNAGCRALPWNPDKSLCDYDGEIDERFGVNGNLPSAFLWSWQGNLLAKNAHVEEVEAAVKRYLDASPRVVIEVEAKKGAEALRSLVQSELTRAGKFTVVTSRDEQARLRRLRKESHQITRRDDQRCAMGQEVSANSVILAKRFRAGRSGERLSLSLQSMETGCVTQVATVPWNERRAEASVAEAITELLDRLGRTPQMPRGIQRPAQMIAPKAVSQSFSSGRVTEALGRLRIEGKPKGALLTIEGPGGYKKQARLPTSLERVKPGRYSISAEANGYLKGTMSATVVPDETAVAKLKLDRPASLTITGAPLGASIVVTDDSGKEITNGSFPLEGNGLPLGGYRIRVSREGYETENHRVELKSGVEKSIDIRLQKVVPRGVVWFEGRPYGARVAIRNLNGRWVADGRLPFKTNSLEPGTYRAEIFKSGYRKETREFTVESGEKTKVDVRLAMAPTKATVRKSAPTRRSAPIRNAPPQGSYWEIFLGTSPNLDFEQGIGFGFSYNLNVTNSPNPFYLVAGRFTLGFALSGKEMAAQYIKPYQLELDARFVYTEDQIVDAVNDNALYFTIESGFNKRWYVGSFVAELGLLAGLGVYIFSTADEETGAGLSLGMLSIGGTAMLGIGGQISRGFSIMLRTGFRAAITLPTLEVDGISYSHPQGVGDRPLEIGVTSTLGFLF